MVLSVTSKCIIVNFSPETSNGFKICFFPWGTFQLDVPLDEVAFSKLDWLQWGYMFSRVTRMGSHIFGISGIRFVYGIDKFHT